MQLLGTKWAGMRGAEIERVGMRAEVSALFRRGISVWAR
jgi:hypothetical protein